MTLQHILLIIGLSIMGVMINIDYTAVNLALITIAKDLHSTIDVMQWILSGYVLAWAAVVIPAGKCADKFGQRRVCAFGLSLFMISSVLTGLSTSSWMMIGARILQGISGAIFIPTLYSLIYSYFPENKRGMAMGLFSLGVGTGAAIGPTFGGLMLTSLGWSWIFYINVPITLVALALILTSTKNDSVTQNDNPIVTSNTVLLGASIVLFMYTLNQLNHYPFFSSAILSLVFSFIALFSFYIVREKRSAVMTIPPSLLQNSAYRNVTLAIAIEQFCFSASFVAIGLHMQNVLHFTPIHASYVFLALSGIFAILSTLGGFMVDKLGIGRPALFGFLLFGLGCYGFVLTPNPLTQPELISVLLIMGAGMGFAFSALNTGMVTTVDQESVGIASSVFIMFALLGNASGVVISTMVILAHDTNTSMLMTGVMCLIGAIPVIALMRNQKTAQVTTT